MLELINKHPFIFRFKNEEYMFVKPNLLYQGFSKVIKPRIKGSTLGWYIQNSFISYNQLKKIITS